MHREKESDKHAKWFAAICLVASILIPLIIQFLFSLNAPLPFFVAQWSAGDMLGYCAGIGGAAATIIAVVMTIREEREGRIETQRLASIPCIALDLPDSIERVRSALSAMKGKMRFIIVRNGQISLKDNLSDEQQPLVYDGPFVTKVDGPIQYCTPNQAVWHLVTMTNAGNGTAVNAKAWLEKDGSAPQYNEKTLHTGPVQLLPGNSSNIFILFEDREDKSTLGEYTLVIDYFDVLGNQYRQSHTISIGAGTPDAKQPTYFDMSIDQQLIETPKKKH